MSRELATTFFPVTFGDVVKNHAPGLFYFLFPDWAAERCPMPSIDLQVPGVAGAVTLYWPVAALVILAGFLTSWCLGMRTILRELREGQHSRQGMFLWAAALLWYGCMSVGGFFFHCLHIATLPHLLDLVGTGLAALSVIGGFAAFAGKVDDRTVKQRVGWVGCAAVFAAVAVVSPPVVREQLYVVPSLLATVAGVEFIRKHRATLQKSEVAKQWLLLSGLGVGVALAMLLLDKWICAVAGANFAFLLWFFLGCNVAILSTHLFALHVANNNIYFTNIKTQ